MFADLKDIKQSPDSMMEGGIKGMKIKFESALTKTYKLSRMVYGMEQYVPF